MPEIKNTFLQGKMNKDLDERLIPNGQYRDAVNVEVSTAEDSSVGTVKNILGNYRVEDVVPGEFRCVGSIANEKTNKLYWFISKYDKDAIIEHDAENNLTRPVLVDLHAGTNKAVLKFFGNIITGINIIDDLLFWTDNQGEPKKININKCIQGTNPDMNHHTQLLFENGSFHGTIVKTPTGSTFPYPPSPTSRYFQFQVKPFLKTVNTWEHNPAYSSNPTVMTTNVRHYRDGKLLDKFRLNFFNAVNEPNPNPNNTFVEHNASSSNSSFFGVIPNSDGGYGGNGTRARRIWGESANNDFVSGDIIFGDNVTLDIEERHITVIKEKPINVLSVKINHEDSATSTSKVPNLFETTFPRFSYRYKYRDGEFSPFAPFTEPIFNPKYPKDTSVSTDANVLYNKDNAYNAKEPYNKAMVNSIHSVELCNFINSQTPEDVIEVEILYKQENSSVIYSIGSIKQLDPEWYDWSNNEGYNLGYSELNEFSYRYGATGSNTMGKYKVTTENIYAALPANQLLRPWDNVPRKAKAQEITGNRIVYGNYLQNYNIGLKPKVSIDYSNRRNKLKSFDSQGLPSIKSQRNYQIGVVYCDRYGRETPVFTSNEGAINIPWQDSNGNRNASKSSQLEAGIVNNFPEWVDSLKFFIKETSNEYYNLTMDRAWVGKSTYDLDSSEGHLWISFPSSDRNKISEEDYIVLKKKIGAGEEQISFENKFKVVDIKNEAPDAIKYELINYGTALNSDPNKTLTDMWVYSSWPEARLDVEGNDTLTCHIDHWKHGQDTKNLPLAPGEETVEDGLLKDSKDFYVSWRRVGGDVELASKKYRVSGIRVGSSNYVFKLTTPITKVDAEIAHASGSVDGGFSHVNYHPDLMVQIEKRELKNEEDFSGKFFVKISKNQITSIIETGNETSALDKFEVLSKVGCWYLQDDVITITGSAVTNSGDYGISNYYGFDADHSYDYTTGNTVQVNYTTTNQNETATGATLRVSDWWGVWSGILDKLDGGKPRWFIDSMHMASGQSQSSDYAKYNCITWAGCTKNESTSAEESSWSYPPIKVWHTEFKDKEDFLTTNPESVWYNNDLISTSPIQDEHEDWKVYNSSTDSLEGLRIDGWVGPLQKVDRNTPLHPDVNVNHINGLEGLVTSNDFHAKGPRRWLSGMNGVDYGVGEDTKTYSSNGEENRHFMHLSFFAPGKNLHDDNWSGLDTDTTMLYGAGAWMANLQGIWGGGVFTGETPGEKFGNDSDPANQYFHVAMEGNYSDDGAEVFDEPPGPGVGYGYDLDYREAHERQWDPTFVHDSNGDFVGDPNNEIRDFIRNLYPGSKFRFNRVKNSSDDGALGNSSISGNNDVPLTDDTTYTIKKVSIKKLYNHTSWRKPYNRYVLDSVTSTHQYMHSTDQHKAYWSVEQFFMEWLQGIPDPNGTNVNGSDLLWHGDDGTGTTARDNIKHKIVDFGANHNRRLCYVIELDKNPRHSTSHMGNPLDMNFMSDGNNGMCADFNSDNFCNIEFVEPVQDVLLSDLSKFPAIWELSPKKKDVDLDIYYEASNNIPVRINDRTSELFAPVGCEVEIINASSPQSTDTVYLTSWNNNVATFDPGFARGDGFNEIDYTDVSFKFIREDGSFTIAEAGGQQLIGEVTGVKRHFIFKEDIGYKLRAGLSWYNCFSFGNGLESNRIKDDFNEVVITNGVKASTTIQETYEEERRLHGLIYSGIYNSNSGVNDLNQFIMAEKSTKDLNPTFGSIQKLFQRRISLIAFCEDRVVSITSNKDAIYNADGNPQLISSNQVLGDANPFVGDYGISKNPESFASESYRAYFTDKQRGTVLRLSKDGLTPISKAGMHDWFRDNLPKYTSLIGTYDSYKENYNITLSNTYVENIIFNTYFQQGVEAEEVPGSLLNIIENSVVTVGSNYAPSYHSVDIGTNNVFDWGTYHDTFRSTVTVTNHAFIPKGHFQQEITTTTNVPDPIVAVETVVGQVDWDFADYGTAGGSLHDDGWFFDPDFVSHPTGYNSASDRIFAGGNTSNPGVNHFIDGQVYAQYRRYMGSIQVTSPSNSTPHSLSDPMDEYSDVLVDPAGYNWEGVSTFVSNTGVNPSIQKKIWTSAYPNGYGGAGSPTVEVFSQCITRNNGGLGGRAGAIYFDRCDPTNSYIEFQDIGMRGTGADGNPANTDRGLMEDYGTATDNYAPAPGVEHSSFYNGDELHIQFEVTVHKTLDGYSAFQGGAQEGYWGWNYIQPQLEIYDGNNLIDPSILMAVDPQVQIVYPTGTLNNISPYINMQTTPAGMGGDFYAANGTINATQNQLGNKYRQVSGGSSQYAAVCRNAQDTPTVTFPFTGDISKWDIGGGLPSQGSQSGEFAIFNITCGASFKFVDPNQLDNDGNPTGQIDEVKLVDDLRIRIKNVATSPTTGWGQGWSNGTFEWPANSGIYPLRYPMWAINKLTVKKGFGVTAPHTDFAAQYSTFDDPSTGTIETWTLSQLQSGSVGGYSGIAWDPTQNNGAGGYVLNADAINNANTTFTYAQPAIPPHDVPAWVEINHDGHDAYSFGTAVTGDENTPANSGFGQWIKGKETSWFGNNRPAQGNAYASQFKTSQVDGTATGAQCLWKEPGPDPSGQNPQEGNYGNPSGYFSKSIVNNITGTTTLYAPGQGSIGPQQSDWQTFTAPAPASQTYDIINDYWRVSMGTNDSLVRYPITWDITGDEYVVGDWYLVDIEFDYDQSTYPDNSQPPPQGTGGGDGIVVLPGVAAWGVGAGNPVDPDNGIGLSSGSSDNAHVTLVPYWRTEYGDDRWVLRAVYQVDASSNVATSAFDPASLDEFALRFYNFYNNPLYVTKIITRNIDYTNNTGGATDWIRNYNSGVHDQVHTLSPSYGTNYFSNGKLCWEETPGTGNYDSAWSQDFGSSTPLTTDNGWSLSFTVSENPRTNIFSSTASEGLCVSVTNNIGDNTSTTFDGMTCRGMADVGNYEIFFNMDGSTNGDTSWTITKDGDPYTTATLGVTDLDTTASIHQNQILFHKNGGGTRLSAAVSNILLTNQEIILQGGSVGSWNFDGFEPTIDEYITWDDAGTGDGDGRIQFTECPTFDIEVVTANQWLDKTINRYEKYEISFTYKMESIEGNPGSGLLTMYYFNSEGYGFRIDDIGDPSNSNISNQTVINNSADIGNGVRLFTMVVGIGDGSTIPPGFTDPWDIADSEVNFIGSEALRNTIVIRRDDTDPNNVTGWIDNISMKRVYDIELDDNNEPLFEPKTVTFSENVNGWTSFKSFIPESGLSLSKNYYTFKDAYLYKHYVPLKDYNDGSGYVTNEASSEPVTVENANNYNVFYEHLGVGEAHTASKIKAVLNAEPSIVKTFNTLNYEGSQSHIINPADPSKVTINNAKAWAASPTAPFNDIDGWKCTEIKTNIEAGNLNQFIKKEGKWFGYIKGKEQSPSSIDTSRFSVQGIGIVYNVTNI